MMLSFSDVLVWGYMKHFGSLEIWTNISDQTDSNDPNSVAEQRRRFIRA